MQIAKQGIQVPKLGVNTDPDATNPVSMVINKALFAAKTVAAGGNSNMQYTLSKETAAATLSLLMQDNFSSRAEMGLLGNDDFTLQVTSTGSSPIQALIAQAATGFVLTPQALGINATPDTTNKLLVNTSAVLFNNIGASIQTKLNKAAVANTASFLFQDAFSGRAEFGLIGDDNFTLKVSPDGSTFNTALVVDKTTGTVTFPNTTFGGGGLVITSVDLDFGTVPTQAKKFFITDASATATTKKVVMVASADVSALGLMADELEMDGFNCAARVSSIGSVEAAITTNTFVTGVRRFNYFMV